MVINYEKKYIFIGLPFSASSAISKELLEKYDGLPLLHKHTNIPTLLRERPDIDLSEYFIFAVVRNPIEMVFSVYNKILTNAHGVYTNPVYFIEYGGHITISARKRYTKLHEYNWSFEDYLNQTYKFIPYDNFLSENNKYLNFIIRFDHIQEDFKKCILEMGLEYKRELPMYNKTKKTIKNYDLSFELRNKIFAPFMNYNKNCFDKDTLYKPSFYGRLVFRLLRPFRSRRWFNLDMLQKDFNKSMID